MNTVDSSAHRDTRRQGGRRFRYGTIEPTRMSLLESEEELKRGFAGKVFGIFSVQIFLMLLVSVARVCYDPAWIGRVDSNLVLRKAGLYSFVIASIAIAVPRIRKRSPANFGLLVTWTFFALYVVSLCLSYAPRDLGMATIRAEVLILAISVTLSISSFAPRRSVERLFKYAMLIVLGAIFVLVVRRYILKALALNALLPLTSLQYALVFLLWTLFRTSENFNKRVPLSRLFPRVASMAWEISEEELVMRSGSHAAGLLVSPFLRFQQYYDCITGSLDITVGVINGIILLFLHFLLNLFVGDSDAEVLLDRLLGDDDDDGDSDGDVTGGGGRSGDGRGDGEA